MPLQDLRRKEACITLNARILLDREMRLEVSYRKSEGTSVYHRTKNHHTFEIMQSDAGSSTNTTGMSTMFISVLSAVPVRESSQIKQQENSRLVQVLTGAGQRSMDSRFHNAYNASLDLDQAEYVWIFFLLC
jgi:hypothetical protein